jgi:hypothetical protein
MGACKSKEKNRSKLDFLFPVTHQTYDANFVFAL